MAYSEEQLRNIKIATLKQIATALKKKMNLGVGITRFAKDNLISFILEHQTEDFVYSDAEDFDADDAVSELIIDELPEPNPAPKAEPKADRRGRAARTERSPQSGSGEAEQLSLPAVRGAEDEQNASAEAAKGSRTRLKRLAGKNSRQAKSAAANAEEESVRAQAGVLEQNEDGKPAERAAVNSGRDQRLRKGRNKRQCANVPLVDKDNEPVAADVTAEWRERGERGSEPPGAKSHKSGSEPERTADYKGRKEVKRLSPKAARPEAAVSGRQARSRNYEERDDLRFYEERNSRRVYGRDDEETAVSDEYWEREDSRYYGDDAYDVPQYGRDEEPAPAYAERSVRGSRRETGDAYGRSAPRDYEDDRYERSRAGRYARPDAYDEYEEQAPEPQLEAFVTGILEIKPDGAGMLRGVTFKECDNNDVFVSSSIIKGCGLRVGDMVTGMLRAPRREESFFSLHKVVFVNGQELTHAKHRPVFDQLIPIYPNQRYILEHDPNELTTRIIDLFAPLGRGQRCLIVAPPKAGKTIMLKNIAMGISANCPEAVLMALLVDERPEEVTDMIRSIDGVVVASTFDEAFDQHIRISKLVLERARRLVEMGKDVVIIMDSLTRLGRACNNCAPTTGRTMSGGLDISALRVPKHLFGSARNIENGGSLTIIATALIETGSKMDEVIFEEFKGTGNMEVNLSRKLAERRIFPAIDLCRSGTRHDELLYDMKGDDMWFATTIRQQLNTNTTSENDYKQVEPVIKTMKPHPTNAEYVARMKSQRSE